MPRNLQQQEADVPARPGHFWLSDPSEPFGGGGGPGYIARMQRMVGRVDERELLHRSLDAARGGAGSLVHVSGVAGMGKSALLAELRASGLERGLEVRGVAAEETDRLRPWAVACRLLGTEVSTADPFGQLLAAAEGLAPLVLTVDDLHLADDDSVDALMFLARRAADLPVLVVTASRPSRADGSADRMAILSQRIGAHVELGPLSDEEVHALAAAEWGGEPGPALRAMLDGVAGNPFLAVELIADLNGAQSIRVTDGVVELDGPSPLGIGLAERLFRRVLGDVAGPGGQLPVRAAAVLPAGFRCEDLAAVCQRPVTEIFDVVLGLTGAGILVDEGGGLRFRHALLREAVNLVTPAAVRDALRRRALDVLCADDTAVLRAAACLIDGFDPANPAEVRWALDLGDRLWPGEPAAAAAVLRAGLRGVRHDDPQAEPAARRLAWASIAAGHPDEAVALAGVFAPASRHRAEWLHAEGFGRSLSGENAPVVGRYAGVSPAEIVAELRADDPYLVDAIAELANGRVSAADLAGGAALIEWVEANAPQRSPSSEATILAARARLAGLGGRFAESIGLATRSLATIAHSPTLTATAGSPALSIALAKDLSGDSDGALAILRATDLPGVVARWTAPLLQFATSIVLYRRGDWDDALAEVDAGLLAGEEIGLRLGVFWPYAVASLVHLGRGDTVAAQEWIDRVAATGVEHGIGGEWLAYAGAMVQAVRGDTVGAAATLAVVCEGAVALGAPALLLGFGPDAVTMALATGQTGTARRCRDSLAGLLGASGSPVAAAALGWVDGLLGEDPRHVAESAAAYSDLGRWPEAGSCAHSGARLALRVGDDALCRQLASSAFAAYDRLGAAGHHARLRAELRDRGMRLQPRRSPSRPSFGWDSLTPSERAIVELVGDGCSNGEIAARMFVGRRTVESHLARVYAKLDVRGRAHLIAACLARRDHDGGRQPGA